MPVPRGTWPPLSTSPTHELIRASLQALELPEDLEVLRRLTGLVDLLSGWSARINLTGHRSPQEVVQGVLGRALGLSTVLPRHGSIADLGSGAGFPGLPLAILWPGRPVTLVESRSRRHHFQLHALRSLGVSNAQAILGRAEALPAQAHDLVIAQAVGAPEKVIELALPWTRAGGRIFVPGLAEPPRTLPSGLSRSELSEYPLPPDRRAVPVWVGVREG